MQTQPFQTLNSLFLLAGCCQKPVPRVTYNSLEIVCVCVCVCAPAPVGHSVYREIPFHFEFCVCCIFCQSDLPNDTFEKLRKKTSLILGCFFFCSFTNALWMSCKANQEDCSGCVPPSDIHLIHVGPVRNESLRQGARNDAAFSWVEFCHIWDCYFSACRIP